MCGIVVGGAGVPVKRGLAAIRHRGPDGEGIVDAEGWRIGHVRLAILDPTPRGAQPFRFGEIVLSFNGEIWNHAALRVELEGLGYAFASSGDTEVLAAALDAFEEDALPRLEGMFALAWVDLRKPGRLFLARDRFGEVPLTASRARPFAAASELGALRAMGRPAATFADVGPGEVWEVSADRVERQTRWYLPPVAARESSVDVEGPRVRELVRAGVVERAISDVPVCCLLSGGIDSAAIAHELRAHVPNLVCFVAVMDERSPDVRGARAVAEHLGLLLVEVRVTPPSADDLARVVGTIEQDSKAQVEIGWPCLALARAISAEGFKVTFSGEGSDELWASYGFSQLHHREEGVAWSEYRRELVLTQARKNFARANKVFMRHGVECRLPFLHRPLVEHALQLARSGIQTKGKPKAVLQSAMQGALPDAIIRRQKMAFQDGLGIKPTIASWTSSPKAYYTAEFRRQFP